MLALSLLSGCPETPLRARPSFNATASADSATIAFAETASEAGAPIYRDMPAPNARMNDKGEVVARMNTKAADKIPPIRNPVSVACQSRQRKLVDLIELPRNTDRTRPIPFPACETTHSQHSRFLQGEALT